MFLGLVKDALLEPMIRTAVEVQGGPGQATGVMIQEGADIAVGIRRIHIVHGPTVLAQFLREDFHASPLVDELLAMKIVLTKKEPFFDNPRSWGCPFGNRAIGFNKLVRQEQKIQAGFCGVHFKGTTNKRGCLRKTLGMIRAT